MNYVLQYVNGHAARRQISQGFFFVSSAAEIRPLSKWDLGDFFPNLKKKFPISKKKKKIFFYNFHSVTTHTHKLHDDNLLELHPIFLQFNGNSMCYTVILLPAHPASFAHKFLFQRVPASPGMQ